MWLANMACIEMHPWLSRAQTPGNPDFAVFDLDPQEGATWDQVVHVAGLVKRIEIEDGCSFFVKDGFRQDQTPRSISDDTIYI